MTDTDSTTTDPAIPDDISDTLYEALESLQGVASQEPALVYAEKDDTDTAMDWVLSNAD